MSAIARIFYDNYKRGVFKDLDYIKIPKIRIEVEEQLKKDNSEKVAKVGK